MGRYAFVVVVVVVVVVGSHIAVSLFLTGSYL
jgi:hypothetical protein